MMTDIEELNSLVKNGNTKAMLKMAWAYRYGKGVEESETIADEWLERAKEQAMEDPLNTEAMTHTEYLNRLAEKGDTKAMEDLAEAGDLQAMVDLAWAYETGEFLEKDPEKSQYWYDRLHAILLEKANNGDRQAMWNLAYAYRHGYGVKKDYAKYQEWRKKYDDAKEQEQDDD